jgi:predicted RNA-binding Zn-ribbon protein involved in translation (DUF1610 family)
MMMHAYGRCPGCDGEGALWIARYRTARKLFKFWQTYEAPVYRCDECGDKK